LGAGIDRLLPKFPGANIKEFQICGEANFEMPKNSFQRAKDDLGNTPLISYIIRNHKSTSHVAWRSEPGKISTFVILAGFSRERPKGLRGLGSSILRMLLE
jgi:hypothetical protein